MMIKKIISIFLCLLSCLTAVAQRTISGTISDKDGKVLIGATITTDEIKDLGTVSDIHGKYSLTFPDNNTYNLNISFIGYESIKYQLNTGDNDEIDFVMREDVNILEQVVVTGTRTPKLLKDAPIVTRVITENDIRRIDATDISDLLETELPGIEFTYSMNQQVSLNMSGFGGNSVLFLVDGERLAGETLDNIDYSRLSMDNVGKIEIVKGAASSLYGSNALGGVVNVISRNSTEPWSFNINTRYGSHNDQRYGGSLGFNKGRINSITNVQYTYIDAIDLSKNNDNEEIGDYSIIYGNKTFNIKERLVVQAADRLKLTGRAGYFFRERNSSQSSKERYRSFNGGIKGNLIITEKSDLELSYSFDQYDKSDYLVMNNLDVRDYSNVQHNMRALYNLSLSKKNILTLGGDYMYDYLMSYQFVNNGYYTQNTTDAFAQFDWNPTEKLNIIGGLRFDYFSAANLKHLSPKLGMMYKMKDFSLRASCAGGFRAPTLKEMYMNFFMGNIFMIYGNPDLKPESSNNFSLSGEYNKNAYNITITGFYNLIDNRITTAWNEQLGGQVYVNMSPMQVAGFDANASARYNCGLSWRLSYAYTYEHIKKGEPMLSSTRPHTATARIAYDKSWNNYLISIYISGRLMSKMTADVYTDMTSYEETVEQTYPAYTIWKLGVMQQFWEGINLNIMIDNLFNYRPDYYYYNSPSTTGTTFSLGLSINFEQLYNKKFKKNKI